MAVFTLLAGSIYLFALKRPAYITVMPGMFITIVVTSYILWISPEHGGPLGIGLELYQAYIAAGFFAILVFAWAKSRADKVKVNG